MHQYIKILQYIIHVGTVDKHLAASRTGQATPLLTFITLGPSYLVRDTVWLSIFRHIQTSNRLSSSKNCEIHNLLIPYNINLLIVINLTHQQYHTSPKSNKTKTHLSLYFFETHPEIYPQHNCNPFERGFHAVVGEVTVATGLDLASSNGLVVMNVGGSLCRESGMKGIVFSSGYREYVEALPLTTNPITN